MLLGAREVKAADNWDTLAERKSGLHNGDGRHAIQLALFLSFFTLLSLKTREEEEVGYVMTRLQ